MRAATVLPDADLTVVASSRARGLLVDPQLVEDARREGYDDGYEAGYAAGVAGGAAAVEAEREELASRIRRLLPQLTTAIEDFTARETTAREQIEHQVVAVAFELAQALLGHELRHSESRGRDAIARALAFAPDDGFVVARLHPDDLAGAGDLDDLVPGRTLRVVADPTVAPGDCIVEVDDCRIDARIEPALARVREVLGP
jgi:flagellar assembly protein FliH